MSCVYSYADPWYERLARRTLIAPRQTVCHGENLESERAVASSMRNAILIGGPSTVPLPVFRETLSTVQTLHFAAANG